jgi:hypothetical protein
MQNRSARTLHANAGNKVDDDDDDPFRKRVCTAVASLSPREPDDTFMARWRREAAAAEVLTAFM